MQKPYTKFDFYRTIGVGERRVPIEQIRTTIDPKYLDISFEAVGIRNSQKRLVELIAETAIQPLEELTELRDNFDLVEAIVRSRVAQVVAHWCKNKHDPVAARLNDKMNDITNATSSAIKNDVTLAEFYSSEVKSAIQSLALMLELNVPVEYEPRLDNLASALNDLGSHPELVTEESEDDYDSVDDELVYDTVIHNKVDKNNPPSVDLDQRKRVEPSTELEKSVAYVEVTDKMKSGVEQEHAIVTSIPVIAVAEQKEQHVEQERAIVTATPHQVIAVAENGIQESVLTITAEEAWQLIYSLIGYGTEYVQDTLLPRWRQNPDAFDKDRRFLYGLFLDTLRNAAGVQQIAGHYTFRDRRITVDALWTHYFSDLAQNVAPQLAAARLHNDANDPWYKKLWQSVQAELGNISPIWLIALAIAMVLDALTTYISLDQTPMEGAMVLMFTVLITALFQIADQLVISYRKREFEAEAMVAKFHAQYEGLSQEVSKLPITSESYVQLSMNKSKANADWQAADDNRKMARRGRFWTARIADINVIVTAYGLSYLFLNSREPMDAIVTQFEAIFVLKDLRSVDPWIFLMVALAITVSFVINTAQRTEILGWSMRRLKQES